MSKNMTLRLSDEQAADVETLARISGVSVAEEVRQAIEARIEARRADKDFKAQIRKFMEENQEALKRLAG